MQDDDIELVYQPVPPDGSNEAFASALEVVLDGSETISIASPYLSYKVVEPMVRGRNFRLVTDLDACLESGVDPSLTDFFEKFSAQLRHLRGLHAKVVLGPRAGLFGSANLTETGFCNRFEMACVVRGSHLNELTAWFEDLWSHASPLDPGSVRSSLHRVGDQAVSPANRAREDLTATGRLGWLDESGTRQACVGSGVTRSRRVSQQDLRGDVVRSTYPSAWWFGVNNGGAGHMILDDVARLFDGSPLSWPIGNSKTVPESAYAEMLPGDRVLVWTGHGRERRWGIIGTAEIAGVERDHVDLDRGVRFEHPLTPYPKQAPKETDATVFLLGVFDPSFKPLGDVRQAIRGSGRTNPITVAKINDVQFDAVVRYVTERSGTR